ncbi:MAG TPA: hypothetical protein VM638_00020, partial [Actinomycetota bacterium]|nr:hypothetical protein [Actinomycetota bacterium]
LAGKTLTVKAGSTTVTATTAGDGTFSANLGLTEGSREVTVTWSDPTGIYRTARVTQTVSA